MTVYIQGKPVGVATTGLEQLTRGQSAFAVLTEPKRHPPPPREPTKEEIAAQRNRDNVKANYHARKARDARLQLNSQPCFNVAIATRADADKTSRIRGKL
jgi:hypothetical protein